MLFITIPLVPIRSDKTILLLGLMTKNVEPVEDSFYVDARIGI